MQWKAVAGLVGAALLAATTARAETLLRFSGRLAIAGGGDPEGARVSLFIDLDRDGKPDELERIESKANADGRYELALTIDADDVDFDTVRYALELIAAYEKDGFASLLEAGPLPLVLTIEHEGYSTVVRKLFASMDGLDLDATLTPLPHLDCTKDACLAADGSVEVRGLSDGQGIARAYAQAFDPERNQTRFPGAFADDADNLLISSAFAELSLRREDGTEIHELNEPVTVKMAVDPRSFASLVDLRPGTKQVELPMYSFDRERGEWQREDDGLLVDEEGQPVSEAAFADLRAGSSARVFVSFTTQHFSFFNCDEPVESRACVKGRLLDGKGKPVAGVSVDVQGASYTGSAGTVTTDAAGFFAADAMKSEGKNEDVDSNGKSGETFTARVTARASGVFIGEAFETPRAEGSVFVGKGAGCLGKKCDCFDLGDIETEFEPPRACRIRVRASFSGRHLWGGGGPLEKGEALAKASFAATMQGIDVPIDPALCADGACDGAGDESGMASFVVPIVGAAPELELRAMRSFEDDDGTLHYYEGRVTVSGCAAGKTELAGVVSVQADHAPLEDIGGFFGDLVVEGAPVSCSCALWTLRQYSPRPSTWLVSVALPFALALRRRQRHPR